MTMKDTKALDAPAAVGDSCDRPLPFPVVAIGASAGGLQALEKLFTGLPDDLGAAFVVITHLEPTHKSLLSEILSTFTRMPVHEAEQDMRLAPDAVYVIPPGKSMTIARGVLQLRERDGQAHVHHPIDAFCSSLAEIPGSKTFCVILSGAGTDGTEGARKAQEAGGVVIVQDANTAAHDGMPRSAAESGVADVILPLDEIPTWLASHLRSASGLGEAFPAQPEEGDGAEHLKKLFSVLRLETGHEFSTYKASAIGRRIQKRMLLAGCSSLPAYVAQVERDETERTALFHDLLIGVTKFFRDREAFDSLRLHVLPRAFKGKGAGDVVRVWVAGCSTGEEAYSIAILAAEHLTRAKVKPEVKILATDIDRQAVDAARRGVYPASIAEDAPPALLEKYFTREGDEYSARPELRDMIIFAHHDLLRDPPFFRLDLVVCRNLLIYLKSEAQKKILSLFYYALNQDGSLFLGPSEALGGQTGLFAPLDRKWRIFKRLDGGDRQVQFPMQSLRPLLLGSQWRSAPERRVGQLDAAGVMEKALAERYNKSSALIDADLNIVRIHGDMGKYMTLPQGDASLNIYKLIRKSLRLFLRSALGKAVETKRAVEMRNLRVDDENRFVTLIVDPLERSDGGLQYLVIFEEAPDPRLAAEGIAAEAVTETGLAAQLEDELEATRRQLQEAVDSFDAVNEELKFSNEELMSMNEELQSSYEELETSKEELQALNEELTIMNSELQAKLEELADSNNYLENLFRSTHVATIFLDSDLKILRFTPAAAELFHLIDADAQRPIGHFASTIQGLDIPGRARFVLQARQPFEQEAKALDGRWYLARFLPFRTPQNEVEGAALTFLDITQLKNAEKALKRSNQELERRVEERTAELREAKTEAESRTAELQAIFGSMSEGLLTVDQGGRMSMNPAAAELLGFASVQDALERLEQYPDLFEARDASGRLLSPEEWPLSRGLAGEPVKDLELDIRRKDIGKTYTANHNATPLRGAGGAVTRVVMTVTDVTKRAETEKALRESEELYRGLFQNSHAVMLLIDPETMTVVDANPAACAYYGYTAEECRKLTIDRINATSGGKLRVLMASADAMTENRFEFKHRLASGKLRDVEVFSGPVLVKGRRLLYSLVHDIGDRKRLEMELREREEHLRLFVEYAPAAIAMLDREMRYVAVSRRWLDDYGLDRRDLLGRSHYEIFPEIPERWKEVHRRCLAGAVERAEEDPFERADGRTQWLRWEVRPWYAASEVVGGVVVFSEDVTERVEARRQLRESQAKLEAALASMTDAVFISDAQGRFINSNDAFATFHRFKSKEECSKAFAQHPDILDVFFADGKPAPVEQWPVSRALRGETGTNAEYVMRRKDTGETWVGSYSFGPIRDKGGEVVGSVVVGRDVTERIWMENALRESEERYRSIFEASLDAVMLASPDGSILAANKAAQEMFGMTEEEILKAKRENVLDASDPRLPEFLAARARDGRAKGELRYRRKDGSIFTGEVSSGLFADAKGQARTASIIRDVTERKRMEERLRQAKRTAEAASLAKSEFLANMSHEIRTPMNGIIGMTELALMNTEDAKTQEYLKLAKQSARHLMEIIGDILDFSRVEAGKIELERKPFNLRDMLDAVLTPLTMGACEKGLLLTDFIAPDAPSVVVGDQTRLRQVLINLISNAIKFTEAGEIRVSVAGSREPGLSKGMVRLDFSVTDSGMGISEEDRQRIFEKFTHIESPAHIQHGGAGLGLAISKSLVEKMGGSLGVRSVLGQGSEFFFSLALEAADESSSPEAEETSQADREFVALKVLLAEDDKINSTLAATFLKRKGHAVTVAGNGREALAALARERFDVVLMDVRMPVLNGEEATRIIRENPPAGVDPKTPIIALTAHALKEDRERFLAAGMNDYISKPVDLEDLARTVARVAGERSGQAALSASLKGRG